MSPRDQVSLRDQDPPRGQRTHLDSPDRFADRHLGSSPELIEAMLKTVGEASLEALVDQAVPRSIRMKGELDLGRVRTEAEVLDELRDIASRNRVYRSFIGMGYSNCFTPAVIMRDILENPGWYTQYTPYQPEISQGRLEALFNFQTMVAELTGLEVANASLLDEATAAAEAMTLCRRVQERRADAKVFFVADHCHPQTIEVVRTRAEPLGIDIVVGDFATYDFSRPTFGALVQYPTTDGDVLDLEAFCEKAHRAEALVVVAADLLALTLLRPPGEFGADVAVGNSQRFGVPLGYGGPHAAYMATTDANKRKMPGRLVGLSKDSAGEPAFRLTLQTREQHIRRERATSNICTAQVLIAIMAALYAVYHGPDGLRRIALRVHTLTGVLARALEKLGCRLKNRLFFDTLRVVPGGKSQADVLRAAAARQINLRVYSNGDLGIALDETTTEKDLRDLYAAFGGRTEELDVGATAAKLPASFPSPLARASTYLENEVFQKYHTETELQRYIFRLQARDLSLTTSMIPLGSCTMKLNSAAEMKAITWPEFANLHPFAPVEQAEGYRILIERLGGWLTEITGFAGVSFQPNAGSQGEYTGLLVIRAYHRSRGEGQRNVCLIPTSAHGTNPASAVLAGMEVVAVACDGQGNIDLHDLRAKAAQHKERLAALMVTYPSTHGVFEESIRDVCSIVHEHGGQVYFDGANMNALIGLARPGEIGADVCHLNLHKTFCIPHGGGGPGMGPICVAEHLVAFLPRHPVTGGGGPKAIGPVAAAPFGSPCILPISYAYIAMMGAEGLTRATQVAILNANYVAKRVDPYFPVLYRGRGGLIAHECIVDARAFSKSAGVDVDDVAKRLMDYGFHAPTMSFPVAGTLMIEPTESESKDELDRLCDALIAIREEIRDIEEGRSDPKRNALKGAPHTARCVVSDNWDRPYSREQAAYPAPWTRVHKFWPPVGRVDNVYGDRNVVTSWCACP
ncbi:MAG: aminomethyl-transferring glycine dehydrogenase [Planctomycetota bacterium]